MVIPKNKIDNKTYYFLLIALGLILINPVIDTKLIPGHDYIFHVSRIDAVATALKHGFFPVRIYVDSVQFWGSPTGIFYPSLFIYVPALLKLIGLPIEICYNIYIALIIFLGLFVSWHGFTLLTKSKTIGLLSTILYVSSGYYLFNAFIRNALGELQSLSFMPLAIACISYIINKSKVEIKIYILALLSISAIIESHVLNTIFLFIFCICYSMFNFKKLTPLKIKRISFLVAIIFLLNSTFIIPFLEFHKAVPLSIHFINEFTQHVFNTKTLFHFIIFWNSWLVISLYIFLTHRFFDSRKKSILHRKRFNYYAGYFLLGTLFVYASSSLFPWNFLYPLRDIFKYMQFPWRFLGIASLFLSICGGVGLYHFLNKLKLNINTTTLIPFTIFICISHILAFTYLTPTIYGTWDMYEKSYWNRKPFYSDEDYLYKGMDIAALYKQGDHFITDAKITNWKKILTEVSFNYETEYSNTKITLPLINYPGYVAINQDGNYIPITENCNHMMTIQLPSGNGSIRVSYKGLSTFYIADYISLVMLISFIFFYNKKRSTQNKLI